MYKASPELEKAPRTAVNRSPVGFGPSGRYHAALKARKSVCRLEYVRTVGGKVIPVVDLFAGPGGLGEGFSAFSPKRYHGIFKDEAEDTDVDVAPFRICLSVEKDPTAHSTLRLRSFYRNLLREKGKIPTDYYSYVRKPLEERSFEQFMDHSEYRTCAVAANAEALNAELGGLEWPPEKIDASITKALGKQTDFILIGGPPCQAYSSVGRSRMRTADPEGFEKDHRHFLYREYLRIIQNFEPAIFVMENVTGLLSSQVKGKRIFEERILPDLREPRRVSNGFAPHNGLQYRVYLLAPSSGAPFGAEADPADYVVKCEDHGIPQARHRLILLGVKSDMRLPPEMIGRLPLKRSGQDRGRNPRLAGHPADPPAAPAAILRIDSDAAPGFPHVWFPSESPSLKDPCGIP